jgi:hypothetical protein
MRVTRFRGEQNVRDLVARLYQIDDGGPSASALGTELAEANRHLPMRSRALADAIPKGTLIAVPDVEGTRPGRTTIALREAAADAVQERATALLARVTEEIAADHERRRAELRASKAQLGSKAFVEAAKEDKRLKRRFAEAIHDIDGQLERLEGIREKRERAVAAAGEANDRLADVLAGRPASTKRPAAHRRQAGSTSARKT